MCVCVGGFSPVDHKSIHFLSYEIHYSELCSLKNMPINCSKDVQIEKRALQECSGGVCLNGLFKNNAVRIFISIVPWTTPEDVQHIACCLIVRYC